MGWAVFVRKCDKGDFVNGAVNESDKRYLALAVDV